MTDYVTKQEIRDWLGVDSSTFSDTFLDSLIAEKMDYVNRLTDMVWNGETQKVRERYDIPRWRGGWLLAKGGYPIYLAHDNIVSIDSLQIYTGDDWEEWIGNKTEGRYNDYWVDYENGVLYIMHLIVSCGGKEIDIKYSYGRTDLPGEVKELTKLYVIRDLLITERARMYTVEGDTVTNRDMLDYIDKRISALEGMLRAYRPVWGSHNTV